MKLVINYNVHKFTLNLCVLSRFISNDDKRLENQLKDRKRILLSCQLTDSLKKKVFTQLAFSCFFPPTTGSAL